MTRQVPITLAQFPISLNVRDNLTVMTDIITEANAGDVVVFPEGALSGYDTDVSFLADIDTTLLDEGLKTLRDVSQQAGVHLIFGSCICEAGRWFNAGIYYAAGNTFIYKKINLATNERGVFRSGDALPTFQVRIGDSSFTAGIQLCREIRFPEQWQHLSRSGAEVIFYLTNAVGDSKEALVWDAHLISRAAENQRFVVAANNAHAEQKCSTMIVSPSGKVLHKVSSAETEIVRETIDLEAVSNWYLDQARVDVIEVVCHATEA